MMFVVLGVAAGVLCAFLRYPFFSLAAAGASLATGAVLHAEREISAAGASAVATETQKAQAEKSISERPTKKPKARARLLLLVSRKIDPLFETGSVPLRIG